MVQARNRLLPVVITFLKAEAGAISAPLRVRRRNMGHEEAFILKPEHKIRFTQMETGLGNMMTYAV